VTYGKFVAKEEIFYQGVRAFWPGDPVPEDSVEANGWENLVETAPESPQDESTGDSGTGVRTVPPTPGDEPGKAAKSGGGRGSQRGS
jgi:hypothetical protein